MNRFFPLFIIALCIQLSIAQETKLPFQPLDVFELEFASDPQISPDGSQIIYRRNGFDIMKDKAKGNLWIVNSDGSSNRKLTSREVNESQACWSPNGDRVAFVSSTDEGAELYMYWIASGQIAKLSQLEKSPSSIIWSPNGTSLAFTMKVDAKPPVIVKEPSKPKGAEWAQPARITDRLKHEADGSGYTAPGFTHVFIIPSQGGTPRQLTDDNYNHEAPLSFSPDGNDLYFTSNRDENWEYDYRNSEVYKVNVASKKISQLTTQYGRIMLRPFLQMVKKWRF